MKLTCPKGVLGEIQKPLMINSIINNSANDLKKTFLSDNFCSWKNISIENAVKEIIINNIQVYNYFIQNPKVEISFNIEEGFGGKDRGNIENTNIGQYLNEWYSEIKGTYVDFKYKWEEKQIEEYLDFSDGIIYGAIGGIFIGGISDSVGLDKNNIIEGITRFIAGNGDTIGGIIQRLKNKIKGGKDNQHLNSFAVRGATGMIVGPMLQMLSNGAIHTTLSKALYTNAYSNADNFIAGIGALIYYIKQKGFYQGTKSFLQQPFQRANLLIILATFIVNYIFLIYYDKSINSQTRTAFHGTLLNLDSILASLYMKNYASRKYKKFIKKISTLKK